MAATELETDLHFATTLLEMVPAIVTPANSSEPVWFPAFSPANLLKNFS